MPGALDNRDLTVEEGTVVALIGPNEAGKTTTVNICATLLDPEAGHVRVAGHDVRREADQGAPRERYDRAVLAN